MVFDSLGAISRCHRCDLVAENVTSPSVVLPSFQTIALQQVLAFCLGSQRGDDFVGAVRVYGSAGFCEDGGQFGQVATPFDGVQSRRFEQREFAAQEDHS